jgi:hypothetical protein
MMTETVVICLGALDNFGVLLGTDEPHAFQQEKSQMFSALR